MKKKFVFISALFTLSTLSAYSQDGSPDSSFGNNGTIQQDISGDLRDFSFTIAEQHDGKLVVAGGVENSNSEIVPTVVRFTENGDLDTSFGNNGVVSRYFGDDQDYFVHIGVQDNGGIIAVGSMGPFGNTEVILNRFLPDGTLDTSFGSNGDLIPFGNSELNSAFTSLDGNSFLVASPVSDGGSTQIEMKKYLPEGTLDTSFGTNGSITIDNGEESDAIYGIEIMSSGVIVIAARVQTNGNFFYSLLRYLPNGARDTTFGTNGVVILPEFQNFGVKSFAVFENGDIVVLQSRFFNNPERIETRLTRFFVNGTYDSSFGGGQGFIDPGISTLSPRTILIQPNQRILLYGELTDFFEGGGNTFIRRYHTNGGGDGSFQITTVLNQEYFAHKMLLQNDGKVVCMGLSPWYNGDEDFVLERYNNSPLGVPEFEIRDVLAFPNPLQNKVTISYDFIQGRSIPYQISDISGKLLIQGKLSGDRTILELSALQSGMYFLNLPGQTIRLLRE